MTASSESSVFKKISDITECSICKEAFKEPKMLPCIHTFCLHCIETLSLLSLPLMKSTCPLCRKEFTIPSGGLEDLPSNFFMNQLLQLNQLSNLTIDETTSKKLCEFCLDEKANAYCIECGQYLCNVCASRHKNAKLFKDHQVVSLTQMPSAEELLKMARSYCQRHPRDEIKFYCYDCKMIACMVCYVDNKHNKHKCSDIKKSGEKFRKLLQKDIDNVNACSLAIDQQLKQLKKERRKLADRVKSVKGEISLKYEYTKALLDSQKKKLMADLDAFEKEKIKEFEIRKHEVEMQFGIMESFNRYCLEMKDKGTPCAVSSSADDLHRRANELVKTRKENMIAPLASVDVKFTPSSTTDTVIGQLAFSGQVSGLSGPHLYQDDGQQSPPLLHPTVQSRSNSIGSTEGTNGGGNYGGGGGDACYGESTLGSRYSRYSPWPSPQQQVFARFRRYTGGSIPTYGGGDRSLITSGTGTLSMPPRSNIAQSTVMTRVSGVGGPPLQHPPPPHAVSRKYAATGCDASTYAVATNVRTPAADISSNNSKSTADDSTQNWL